jgi:hypothetical protein
VGGVAAEPGMQAIRPGPAVWAADPGGVLVTGLLAVVFGQARRQRRPDLLECAPQPADAPVGLALTMAPAAIRSLISTGRRSEAGFLAEVARDWPHVFPRLPHHDALQLEHLRA